MLVDPFYDPTPAYSANHSGVIEIKDIIGIEAVPLMLAIKDILTGAGWTPVAAGHSTGELNANKSMIPVVTVPTEPKPLVPNPIGCTGLLFPQNILAEFEDMKYVAYDPYTQIKPVGCEDRIFFPAGTTVAETADNLASEINARSSAFLVTYTGITDNRVNFHVESRSPAWENDYKPIFIGGGGSKFTSKGYYTYRSKTTPEGGYLEAKLQAYAMWGNFGIQEDAVIGALTPFITVRASGGGSDDRYQQSIHPSGMYFMCASAYQFAIWSDRTGSTASALVASLLKPDKGHTSVGVDGAIVYGSEGYTWLGWISSYTQVTRQLHWEHSYATGLGNTLKNVTPKSQEASTVYWRSPTLLHRGLRGLPLKTVTSMPLVTSAYAMVSDEPNLQTEVQIGGRLWDMIVASDSELNTGLIDQDGMALYDGFHWIKLATASLSGDLTSSLWVKIEAGGG